MLILVVAGKARGELSQSSGLKSKKNYFALSDAKDNT